jgi:hypothetical protein
MLDNDALSSIVRSSAKCAVVSSNVRSGRKGNDTTSKNSRVLGLTSYVLRPTSHVLRLSPLTQKSPLLRASV